MTNIQFLSGLNTIGSNIADIWTDSARVIFDYGVIGDPETGELADWNKTTAKTAVLISHLHIDHTGSLHTVPKDVPIYMSRESYELFQKLVDLGEEPAISDKPTLDATVYPLDYDEEFQIGDITVTAKKSDHDIKGACAFFIHTPDMKLIYSGDVRLSGNHPQNVLDWMEDAKEFDADILLLESTAYSFDEVEEEESVEEVEEPRVKKDITELELYEVWAEMLKEKDSSIIFLNTYIRDLERLKYLSKKAKSVGRKVVLEPTYANLLDELDDYHDTYVLKELDTDEKYKDRWMDLASIKANPGAYVLQNSYNNRALMEEFTEGVYAHSNGEPLGEYDPRYNDLVEELASNHFTFEKMGASGHASKVDLVKIAETVGANLTIPWHGFLPERLAQALGEAGLSAVVPERGVVYSMNRADKYE